LFLSDSASVLAAIFSTIRLRHRRGEIGFPLGWVRLWISSRTQSVRDDNYHGGEETEGKGWNQAVVSYIYLNSLYVLTIKIFKDKSQKRLILILCAI